MKGMHKVRIPKDVSINYYVADFETTTMNSNYFIQNQQGELIAWLSQEIGNFQEDNHGVGFESFERWLLSLTGVNIIFFHNLTKFDAYVIIWWARRYWSNNIKRVRNSKIEYDFQKTDDGILSMTIKTPSAYIKLQDSLKLLSYSVAALGKNLGEAKLETDYDIDPVEKWEDLPEDYRTYLLRDVVIVNKSLCEFYTKIKELSIKWNMEINPFKLTASSLARDLIKNFDKNKNFEISIRSQNKASNYYKGGYTHFNHNYVLELLENVPCKMYDAKSHYPSIMWNYYLPNAEPNEYYDLIKFKEDFIRRKRPKWKVIFVKVTGSINKSILPFGTIPNHKDVDNYHYYTEEGDYQFEFYGLLHEWRIQLQYYKFNHFEFEEVFYWVEGQKVLKPMIEELYWLKENTKDNLTYKIILNAGYGSTGMKHTYDTMFFEEKGIQPKFSFKVKGKNYQYVNTKMENYYPKHQMYAYLEIRDESLLCWNKWYAAAVTSNGRYILQKFIARDAHKVLYCDTDSIIMFNDAKIFKDEELGKTLTKWDLETDKIHSILIGGAKRYFLWDKDKNLLKSSYSGVNKDYIKNKGYQELIEIFDQDYLEEAQRKVIKKEIYGFFPFIEPNDYIDWQTKRRREKYGKK